MALAKKCFISSDKGLIGRKFTMCNKTFLDFFIKSDDKIVGYRYSQLWKLHSAKIDVVVKN